MKNNIKIISVIIVSLLLTTINIFGSNKQAKTNYVISDTVKSEISFNPNLTYGSVTDVDGNVYKTILIGTQTWMAENLKTTKYRNGDLIGTTTLSLSGQSNPKYQWPPSGYEPYVPAFGRLYTWYAVTDSRGVCPTGWHLSNGAEWTILVTYLGGASVAGNKLKAVNGWDYSGGTNESGFTALGAGSRDFSGGFSSLGAAGYWWCPDSTNWTIYRYNLSVTSNISGDERHGFSVRCVRD